MAAFGNPAITPSSARATASRTSGTPYMSPPEPRAAPASPSSTWLSSQAGKDYLKKYLNYEAPTASTASQRTATERPARSYGTVRPPSPTNRGDERYFRPEGYVANSTMWAQHTPTPEPVAAPYNPAPPQAQSTATACQRRPSDRHSSTDTPADLAFNDNEKKKK
jgi:hypothetical protein